MTVLVGSPEKLFEGEGGIYYAWSSSNMPVLASSNVGACKLLLPHKGFAFPHYGDSTKIAFVLQGSGEGMAGLISPDTKKETVVSLKKGDCITINQGVVSWWYNPGDSALEIVFMGETSDAIVPGQFTYLFLAGNNGMLNYFSQQFISKLYNISDEQASRLATSQAGMIAVKLKDGSGPELSLPRQDCFNFECEPIELQTCRGSIKKFRSGEDDRVKVGPKLNFDLTAFEIKLEPHGAVPPLYMTTPAAQLFFVVSGGAWVQIVSGTGGLELDKHVDAGNLFVVPKYYTVAIVAEDQGLHCLSLMTTSKPVLGQFANVLSALSPGALEAALNLEQDNFEKADGSKIKKASIITSPHHHQI